MKREPSIKVNFVMNAILTMSSFIFPLITFPYVSRVLLPAGTGKVAFAVALISYFNMFAQLGIPTYGVRACAKVRDNKLELTRVTHELLVITLITSVISYVVLIIALLFIPRLHEERMLYLVVSATILLTAIGMEWLYKALEKYTYIAIRSIIFKIIALGAMFLLIHSKDDYVIYGGISIFAASASNIVNFINARKYIDWRPVGGYSLTRHAGAVGVFFAISCATLIYTYVDELMLGFMTTNVDVGYYDAAVKIKNILVSVVTSLGVVILPRASYYVQNNRIEEFWNVNKKALNFVLLISIPLGVYFILFANNIIYFLAGKAFGGAILPMQIIIPTILLIGLTNIMGIQILVPLNRELMVLGSVILGAVVDIILNIILIPKYAASGAAVGTLVAEISVLIFQYCVLRKDVRKIFATFSYWKIVIAVALGGGISLFARELHFGNFSTIVISGVVFFGIYLVLLMILKEKLSLELLSDIVHKIKRQK